MTEKGGHASSLRTKPRSSTYYFSLHTIGQNLDIWSHLAIRKTRNTVLAGWPFTQLTRKKTVWEEENTYWRTAISLCHIILKIKYYTSLNRKHIHNFMYHESRRKCSQINCDTTSITRCIPFSKMWKTIHLRIIEIEYISDYLQF